MRVNACAAMGITQRPPATAIPPPHSYQPVEVVLVAATGASREPTEEELRRFDKKRKDKRVSNEEWTSTTDPESRIAKMKDGRTHLAYKAEHVIDLETELVLAAEIHPADAADVDTLVDSVMEACVHLDAAGVEAQVAEAVADKGYHAAATIELAESLNVRTYIPEPKRQRAAQWKKEPAAVRHAALKNRRRTRGARSKRLQRLRSERVERSFAHVCDTGGARRSWLCGIEKVQKRYWIAAVARNLGLVMCKLFGMGTPRGLQAAGGLAPSPWLTCLHTTCLIARPRRENFAVERRWTPRTRPASGDAACATAA